MAFSSDGKDKKCIWVKYEEERASLAQGFQTAWRNGSPFWGVDTEFFPDMADYKNLEYLEFSTSVIVF